MQGTKAIQDWFRLRDDQLVPRILTKKDRLVPLNHEIVIDVNLLRKKVEMWSKMNLSDESQSSPDRLYDEKLSL